MDASARIGPRRDLLRFVETIEEAVEFLSRSDDLHSARQKLETAIAAGKDRDASEAARDLLGRLRLIAELTKLAEAIDPHVLDRSTFQEISKKKPMDVVGEAVVEGKLRERRIILQGMEAQSNRRLARVAILASGVALFVPILERLLRL